MAFTRLFYDKDQVQTRLNEDYNNINYIVNVPGNGEKPYFIDDPHIRMQKFGGNLSYNLVDINSSLLGLDNTLSHCEIKHKNSDMFSKINFPVFEKAVTDQPRTMQPAWLLRDKEQINWQHLHYNPQIKAEINFDNNLSSRILEKNNYDNNINY